MIREDFMFDRDLGDETDIEDEALIEMESDVAHAVTLYPDAEGNGILELPDEVLARMGWTEGDDIEIEIDGDQLVLTKVE